MDELDVRGLSCPMPVMETAKILEGTEGGSLVVIVDNATARDNVMRLAKSKGCAVAVERRGEDFYLIFTKG